MQPDHVDEVRVPARTEQPSSGPFPSPGRTTGRNRQNATPSEGGFDLAVFEGGQFVDVVDHKLWRSRIGPNEERRGGETPGELFSDALNFPLLPGNGYAVNVGVRALSDRTPDIGAAAVQSLMRATIARISVLG
ncbi:hypothetical protein [Streptomyces sp. NPDC054975]